MSITLPASDLNEAFDYLNFSKENIKARNNDQVRNLIRSIDRELWGIKANIYCDPKFRIDTSKLQPELIIKIDKIYEDKFGKRQFSLSMIKEVIKILQKSGYSCCFGGFSERPKKNLSFHSLKITW